MSYLVLRGLLTFEDGSDKSVVLEEMTEDLITYREKLIKENNAQEVYLSYEQEDNNGDSDNIDPSLIDFIKPLNSGV